MKSNFLIVGGLILTALAIILIDALQPVHVENIRGKLVIISSAYTRPGGALNPLGRKVVLKGIFKGEEIRIILPREILFKNQLPLNEGSVIEITGQAFFKNYTKKLKIIRAIEVHTINGQVVTTEAWVLDPMFHKDKIAFPLDEQIYAPIN